MLATSSDTASLIRKHIPERVSSDLLRRSRQELLYFGFTKVSYIVPDPVKEAIRQEALELIEKAGVRRDLKFKETGNTPRKMRNVRRAEIAAHNGVIPRVYADQGIQDVLSAIAGEDVLECPYEPEQFLITRLEQGGDTHGWHWDDYRYALVWVIESPPVRHGGYVQCVPGTTWDKRNPAIDEVIVANPIYSLALGPGDLYFIRTDTTMHRVAPLVEGRRTIINMGYASPSDLEKDSSHETMDALWAPEEGK